MESLRKLTDEQLSAVRHIQGAARIDACPGAGKTTTLSERIAYLLSKKVPSGKILSLSFTKRDSEEMFERVKRMTGEAVKITTFHKWAISLLREGGIPFTILSPAVQNSWFKENLSKFDLNDEREVRRVMNIIDKAKNNCFVSVEAWSRSHFAENLDDETRELIEAVWTDYQAFCKKNRKIDLTDLLAVCYSSWKKEAKQGTGRFLRAAGRIDHLMVDEFQDTNPLQMKLINLWAAPHEEANWENQRSYPTSLVVCGDVDQAIYGFRGSEPTIFLNFPKVFKDCKIFTLTKNYRSTETILTNALSVISNNVERTLKEIEPKRSAGCRPQIFAAEETGEEIDWVMNEIGELHQKGEYEIAILARNNSTLEAFQKALTNLGYQVQGENFLRLQEVDIVRNLLKIGVELHPVWIEKSIPESLKPALRRAFVVHKKTGISLFEALASDQEMHDWIQTVRRISSFVENGEYGNALAEAFNFNNFFHLAVCKMGEEIVYYSRVEKMLRLIAEAGEITLKDSRLGVRAILDLLSDEKKVNSPIDLMTIHGSKGGEWKHVFMVGLNSETFPGDDFETLEEERRVFYVAMTRAKETLSLSGLKYNLCPFVAEMSSEVVWITKEDNLSALTAI